jgi:hypothetical protein
MTRTPSLTVFALILMMLALPLSGCGGIQKEAKYPTGQRSETGTNDIYSKPDSIFGPDGLSIFGGRSKDAEGGDTGIGVNSFLWRASLDTVSFMPLASADPFGGTILTDWYTPDETKGERFKLNVFIMGRQLRSDGVRVRVFKQVAKGGVWRDEEAAPETARQLEDTILTRARQMRIAQDGGGSD